MAHVIRPEHMRHGVLLVLGAAVLIGTAACGQRPTDVQTPVGTQPVTETSGDVPQSPGPTADPAAWQSFPVDRKPRPIVLLAAPPVLEGFTTDAAKMAALNGNYELSAELPATPPTVTAQLSDGPAQFRPLSAAEAVTELQTKPPGPLPNPTDALPITRVELGTAQFSTDRGQLTLPAWLFHATDALGPIAWPALPPEAFWPHQSTPSGAPPARLADDGTLTISMPAAPPACPGEQTFSTAVVLTESATTVSVGLRRIPGAIAPGAPQPNCAHDLALRFDTHQVKPTAPLGARVLLDGNGPIAVTR